jgi:cell division protein FtsQ
VLVSHLLDLPPTLLQRAARVLSAGVVGAALVTAIGVGLIELRDGPAFRLGDVRIEGNHRATTAELRHLANLRPGEHMLALDLEHTAQNIARHPWVASASVRRLYPSSVSIDVVEHVPVMLLALDRLWYVDASGKPFKQAESGDLDHALLTGVDPALVSESPHLAHAVIVGALQALDATNSSGALTSDDISEVHYSPSGGYSLITRSGARLLVGISDPTPRLERLRMLVEQGLDLSRPQVIDLDLADVALVRPWPPAAIPIPETDPATPGT